MFISKTEHINLVSRCKALEKRNNELIVKYSGSQAKFEVAMDVIGKVIKTLENHNDDPDVKMAIWQLASGYAIMNGLFDDLVIDDSGDQNGGGG